MNSGFALHKIVVNKNGKPIDYIFLDINSAFETLTGLNRNDILNKKVTEVLPGIENDPADWIERYGKVALTRQRIVFEHYSQNIGRWYSVQAFSPEKGQFITIFDDVTQKHRAETAIRQSEEKYRKLYEDAAIGIFHSSFEGRFLDVNPSLARMLGYETPQDVLDAIHDIAEQIYVEPQARDEVMSQLMNKGETIKIENRYRRKDGSEWNANLHLRYVYDTNGKPICLEGFVEDITERKYIEQALRESEEKYRILFEHTGEALFIAQDGRIVFQIPRSTELSGYSTEEFHSKPFIDFIHEDDRETVVEYHTRRLRGEKLPERYSFRIIHKNGSILWTELNAVLIQWDGKPAVLCFMTDITDRKHAEDALIDSETLFRGMFKDHSAVMLLIAPDTGQIIKANKAAAQYYGYSLEKMLQMKIQQLNVLSPAEVSEQMRYALNKQVNSFEFKHLLSDGRVRDVEVPSSPIIIQNQALLFSIVHDITERKKAEDELLDNEKLLSQSQEIGHIGSWKLDLNENSLIWSDEIYRIFGYEPHEFPVTYEAFLDAVHPDDREMVNIAYTDSIREGRNEYEIQHRIIRSNTSEIRTIHERCIHERDEAGKIVRSVGIAQDITEQKRAEEALRREEERFRTLVENTVDWIWQVDTGCRYIYVSPQAEELLGYGRNEILGKTPFDFMSADEVQRVTPIFLKSIEKRERII